jgi:hypothetical protein
LQALDKKELERLIEKIADLDGKRLERLILKMAASKGKRLAKTGCKDSESLDVKRLYRAHWRYSRALNGKRRKKASW